MFDDTESDDNLARMWFAGYDIAQEECEIPDKILETIRLNTTEWER